MICPICHGAQMVNEEPCPECGGCGFSYCCEGAPVEVPVVAPSGFASDALIRCAVVAACKETGDDPERVFTESFERSVTHTHRQHFRARYYAYHAVIIEHYGCNENNYERYRLAKALGVLNATSFVSAANYNVLDRADYSRPPRAPWFDYEKLARVRAAVKNAKVEEPSPPMRQAAGSTAATVTQHHPEKDRGPPAATQAAAGEAVSLRTQTAAHGAGAKAVIAAAGSPAAAPSRSRPVGTVSSSEIERRWRERKARLPAPAAARHCEKPAAQRPLRPTPPKPSAGGGSIFGSEPIKLYRKTITDPNQLGANVTAAIMADPPPALSALNNRSSSLDNGDDVCVQQLPQSAAAKGSG